MPGEAYQVVVLVGGECKRMYPVTSGSVKALLPVGNRPLLTYPLKNLAEAGIKTAIVVAIGDAVAASVSSFLQQQPAVAAGVTCDVVAVGDECGTADALRAVVASGRLTAGTVVVYSGDLVADVPLSALVVKHQISGALATVLVGPRRTSPTTETKPGKAPRGVDYLGLDPSGQLLLASAPSPDALRDLQLPLAAVARHGSVHLRSDLVDLHLYALSRAALQLLMARPQLTSLKLDVVPLLARHHLRHSARLGGIGGGSGDAAASPPDHSDTEGEAGAGARAAGIASACIGAPGGGATTAGASAAGTAGTAGDAAGGAARAGGASGATGASAADADTPVDYMSLSHGGGGVSCAGCVGVYVVPPGCYCARVSTVAAYGDVNREVAASDTALHLTGLAAGKHDNVVPPSASLGAKATVGPACILGERCAVGDKSSVKRSVLGCDVRLGSGCKVINCVIMDGVSIGDGCHIQNAILCSGCVVQERSSLKDCQVGPGFVVAQGSDHRGETLARS